MVEDTDVQPRSAMNGENYNIETAQSYLLGSLPEQETLRYDELSFIDDGFNDFLRNVENDLVDSYVNGDLDAAARTKFESFYLATPKRRQKIAFADAFRQCADRDPTIEVRPVKVGEMGFWKKLRFALRPQLLAFGVVALLCTLGAIWFIRNLSQPKPVDVAVTEPRNTVANIAAPQNLPIAPEKTPDKTVLHPVGDLVPDESPAKQPPEVKKTPAPEPVRAPVIASFVLTPPLRGAGEAKSLEITPNVDRATFRLELEPTDFKTYKIELLDQSNKVVWNAGNLKPKGSAQPVISATVPAQTLKPQIYIFRVSGIAPDGTKENIGDYAFRIVR